MSLIKFAINLVFASTLAIVPITYAEVKPPVEDVAASQKVKTLEGLLQQVERFQQQESAQNIAREKKFKDNKQNQQALLNKANNELKAEQKKL